MLAIFAFYFLFIRGAQAKRTIDIDINTPKNEMPVHQR